MLLFTMFNYWTIEPRRWRLCQGYQTDQWDLSWHKVLVRLVISTAVGASPSSPFMACWRPTVGTRLLEAGLGVGLLLAAAPVLPMPVVPMNFTTGSRCGLYVGKAPAELLLIVQAGQVVQTFPNLDPDQSRPMLVQLAYPGEALSPALPAAFESRRVRNGGTYRYRILSSGSADDADVRFCVIR